MAAAAQLGHSTDPRNAPDCPSGRECGGVCADADAWRDPRTRRRGMNVSPSTMTSSISVKLQDRLVDVQRSVRTRPLFTMRLETKLLAVGLTPTTQRRIGIVPGGTFEGERL